VTLRPLVLSASELRSLLKVSSYPVRLVKKGHESRRGAEGGAATERHSQSTAGVCKLANHLSQWPCGPDSPFRVNFQRVGSIKCTWEAILKLRLPSSWAVGTWLTSVPGRIRTF
jgi:hypothetical protein